MATEQAADRQTPPRRVNKTWIAAAVAVAAVIATALYWYYAGRESTDDAHIEGHITHMSARVGGAVRSISVKENQRVNAGDILLQIAPEDYQIAVDRAAADLADAEAAAQIADVGVPIAVTTTASDVTTAGGGVEQANAGVSMSERELDAATARLTAAKAHQREKQADAMKAQRDVDRLKTLIAKDEISQQQFDSTLAAAESARAAADAASAEATAAEHAVQIASSRIAQARGAASQAQAALASARTAPQQLVASRARAQAAAARVQQAKAALAQARLNLEYATVKAPAAGVISRKTVEVGQVVQSGQPLLAIVGLDDLWVVANFKETQLEHIRPGQRAVVEVDAFGGQEFDAQVESVAPATGAKFSLLPAENATGNYVKVVQRVPVKLVLQRGSDPEHQLRPGLSVVPTIYTR